MSLPSSWSKFLAAIRAQETGGSYTGQGSCLGAYCWSQGTWNSMATAAGYGQYSGQNPSRLSPQIQDAVASYNLQQYYNSTSGSSTQKLLGAAMAWNGGQTTSVPNVALPSQSFAPNCGSGSTAAYACQVLARMGGSAGTLPSSSQGTVPSQSGTGGTSGTSQATLASAQQSAAQQQQATCAFGIPSVNFHLGSTPAMCFISKKGVRVLVGSFVILCSGIGFLAGLFLLMKAVEGTKVGAAGAKGAQALTDGLTVFMPETAAARVASAGVTRRRAAAGRARHQAARTSTEQARAGKETARAEEARSRTALHREPRTVESRQGVVRQEEGGPANVTLTRRRVTTTRG